MFYSNRYFYLLCVTYKKINFFIQQAYVKVSGKGSVSTKARTNKVCGINHFN